MQTIAVRRARQQGFSLAELMVAMVITVIVSGSIYALLASGQNAFRREPALVERQQNIRLGLDLITRDILDAGVGMDPWMKVFETGLNNPASSAGSVPSELISGERADFLQLLTNDGTCPMLSSCGSPGVNIDTYETIPSCFQLPGLGYVFGPGGAATKGAGNGPDGILYLETRGGGGGCGSGHVNAPPGQAWVNPTGSNACQTVNGQPTCSTVAKLSLIRYELANDPCDGVPALWRSTMGRLNPTVGSTNAAPPTACGTASGGWNLVARGIEDMQVQYQTGAQWPGTPNTWLDDPGTPTCTATPCAAADFQTIVQRVKVTLSGRALGANTQLGGLTSGAQTTARRGQLTTTVTVRSALINLQQAPGAPPWH
jgi:prepilin-type N-terminal cleavage/methylation domain-containing protein